MTKQSLLKLETTEYMQTSNMTQAERQYLLAWIQGGNSAYDNPWYMADEKGYPMDYISAMREVNNYRHINNL